MKFFTLIFSILFSISFLNAQSGTNTGDNTGYYVGSTCYYLKSSGADLKPYGEAYIIDANGSLIHFDKQTRMSLNPALYEFVRCIDTANVFVMNDTLQTRDTAAYSLIEELIDSVSALNLNFSGSFPTAANIADLVYDRLTPIDGGVIRFTGNGVQSITGAPATHGWITNIDDQGAGTVRFTTNGTNPTTGNGMEVNGDAVYIKFFVPNLQLFRITSSSATGEYMFTWHAGGI